MRLTQGNLPLKEERGFFVGNFSFKSRSSPSNAQLESAGEITPRTQSITLMRTPAGASRRAAWICRRCGGICRWNRMSDRDGIPADQDFPDQEANDFSASHKVQPFSIALQSCTELAQAIHHAQIAGLIGCSHVQ